MSACSQKKLTRLAVMPHQAILMVKIIFFATSSPNFDSLRHSFPFRRRSSSERLSGFEEEAEQMNSISKH
jgi:hypothetical protein